MTASGYLFFDLDLGDVTVRCKEIRPEGNPALNAMTLTRAGREIAALRPMRRTPKQGRALSGFFLQCGRPLEWRKKTDATWTDLTAQTELIGD